MSANCDAKTLSPLRSASAVQNLFRACVTVKQISTILLLTASVSATAETCNVLQFGAKGDGKTLDTVAIQRAIDAAAGTADGVVLIPRKHTFLVSTLELKGGIDFRIEGTLLISTNQADYAGDGVLTAMNAPNLKITGHGKILGQSLAFM
ncbi:MAG TPA: glycosyl hydrolase family 28-related protein, partial [Candidatus Binatia bacterium]|nr:glycosyl hydrolase family 28-related protein [Candidatus Binatia bacterium]